MIGIMMWLWAIAVAEAMVEIGHASVIPAKYPTYHEVSEALTRKERK